MTWFALLFSRRFEIAAEVNYQTDLLRSADRVEGLVEVEELRLEHLGELGGEAEVRAGCITEGVAQQLAVGIYGRKKIQVMVIEQRFAFNYSADDVRQDGLVGADAAAADVVDAAQEYQG
jgi:hypothetical protein